MRSRFSLWIRMVRVFGCWFLFLSVSLGGFFFIVSKEKKIPTFIENYSRLKGEGRRATEKIEKKKRKPGPDLEIVDFRWKWMILTFDTSLWGLIIFIGRDYYIRFRKLFFAEKKSHFIFQDFFFFFSRNDCFSEFCFHSQVNSACIYLVSKLIRFAQFEIRIIRLIKQFCFQ